ncbi:signal recognition particle-docking protein FtsY [Rhizobiales bacterium]|uniref:signal recognition particle-docking protein FtsY n=1 Tax=Hongsoonwoonella zoysiae TaxID=2821844 RepID=UPI0015618459|nr:signal recognition particle-docking protein FtsY [Hongsoonwoonella zoysiae]NRG17130.1 signal recognition particle-docking protein FtsY [Hongsoonwoonella zoysiae]
MSEKKRGFLGRLFGAKDEAAPEGTPSEESRASEAEAAADISEERQAGSAAEPEVKEAEAEAAPDAEVGEEEPAETTLETFEPEPVTAQPEPSSTVQPKPAKEKKSWFSKLRDGLSRSSSALTGGISAIFTKRKLDADTLEELEDILIQADLGVETAMNITERLADGRYDKEISEEEVRRILAEEVKSVLEPVAKPLEIDASLKPHVILVVGVNGTGKTTTIGKLSAKFAAEGRRVMLAAGDTFRAAAVEQLKIWGERTGADVIARDTGADAAGLVFDAMKEAREKAMDVLLIDTAGRLQNRAELMAELEKVVRVIKKHDESAPHTVLLTLDATTGQNAMNQVEIFGRTAGVSGLVMTKLDGTARGGILVAISAKHRMPVHFIGVGEGVDDLEPFKAEDFAKAIAGLAG